jgi:hypothetical protein
MFTRTCHWSLSWAMWIQYTSSFPVSLRSTWTVNLQLIYHFNVYASTQLLFDIWPLFIVSQWLLKINSELKESLISAAGIAQWYSTGLWAGWLGVWVWAGLGIFSLHHCAYTGSGAHSAPYPVGTRGSFPGSKAARSWIWPLTSS